MSNLATLTVRQNRLMYFSGTTPASQHFNGQLSTGDTLRFKLGQTDTGAPLIDLESSATVNNLTLNANGSGIVITSQGSAGVMATYQIFLGEDDLTMIPGIYNGELLLVSSADDLSPDTQLVQFAVYVLPSMAGSLG